MEHACDLLLRLAEGEGLEPPSPFGQRFSSVWIDVLVGPGWPCLNRSLQVSERAISWVALPSPGSPS